MTLSVPDVTPSHGVKLFRMFHFGTVSGDSGQWRSEDPTAVGNREGRAVHFLVKSEESRMAILVVRAFPARARRKFSI